jgi:ABC-type Fe3+ transport system substrate-binding protein
MRSWLCGTAALLLLGICGVGAAPAADLPPATLKAMTGEKIDPALLAGVDQELAVPPAWIEAAKREKDVIILGTWNDRDFRALTEPFRERYPFVNLRYSRTGTSGRGMKVLVALQEGRVIADVLTSIGDATGALDDAKALADLRDLPGFRNVPSEYVAEDGTWVSYKLSFRCMAYNTAKLSAADMPATWEDLLTSPKLRSGNLAISNLADSWLLVLWGQKGEAWGENFTRRLFKDVRPQRRKEGMNATAGLVAAGEADASLPAGEDRAQQYRAKGAPIGYHCPAPITMTVSQIAMLEASPRKNAARLFINWVLSREGQVLQHTATHSVPVHKDLQTSAFLAFPETIVGKPRAVRDDALIGSPLSKRMQALWNDQWADNAEGGKAK